jgi:hypothetical protein
MRLKTSGEEYLTHLRLLSAATWTRWETELLATRGERLALFRERIGGTSRGGVVFESEEVVIEEVDRDGRIIEGVGFDPDDLDAAYAELNERYAVGEAGHYCRVWAWLSAFSRAGFPRDWDAVAAPLALDLIVSDAVGFFPTLHGPPAYVEYLKSWIDLAPDVWVRLDHIRMAERGALSVYANLGTREGGEFETPRALVAEYDGRGTINRLTLYDLAHLEAALAHFDRIRASTLHDPLRQDLLRIPPNAASRADDRYWEYVEKRDWEALRQLCAPIVWEDRRRLIRTSGDCDMVVANAKLCANSRTRPSHTLLATAGDRLALLHERWRGTVDGGAFETDALVVDEVDAEGCLIACISFDLDDRRAASAEMLDRHARSGEAPWLAAGADAFRAINAHDLDRFRATLHDDFVFDDHRRTGVGRLEGADAYVASVRPLLEASPDFATDNLYSLVIEPHGSLVIGRTFGTLAEGGEFESVFVRLFVYRGDRLARVEQFELDDLDVARARFEELRPEPA